MRALIQLAIVGLILNAGFQAAQSYYTSYDFKAKLGEEIYDAPVATTSELHQHVIDLATEYGINIKWEDVQIHLESGATVVEYHYIDQVPLFPKYYVRPWPYAGRARAVRPRPIKDDERR